MSDPMIEPEKSNEVVTINKTKSYRWANVGILFTTFALIIFIGAFAYGYYQLAQINVALADALSTIENRTMSNQQEVSTLKSSMGSLEQNAQKSAELSAKQEKIMADWEAAQKGNLIKWYAAEAQYLVKLANDHLLFTHDKRLALTLLERAQQVLANLPNGDLLDVKKSIADDITKLQTTAVVDTTTLYVQLHSLNGMVDQLPLPSSPMKADTTQNQTSENTQNLPWWKAGLTRTWDALGKIVVVRNENDVQPIVLPDEKMFLYQNLHAQLESAMWAVLNHNQSVYQTSLSRTIEWIKKYFDQSAQPTISLLDQLQNLSKNDITPPVMNLTDTLQLFDKYFASDEVKTPGISTPSTVTQ